MTVHLADENKLCQKNKISKGKGRQLRVPTQHPVTVVCPQQSKQEGSAAKRPQGGGKTVVHYKCDKFLSQNASSCFKGSQASRAMQEHF